MGDIVDAISRVLDLYNNGKPGDVYREVAGHILYNLNNLEGLTIYEIAEICYASPTTLSRFSKKAGYQSFSEFKIDLTGSVRKYSNLNRSMPYAPKSSCKDTIELYYHTIRDKMDEFFTKIDADYISSIVKDMNQYNKFSFYTNMHSLVSPLQKDLLMCGKGVVSCSELSDQLQDARSLDLTCLAIVVIPKRLDSVYILEVLKTAKEAGSKVLLISAAILSQYDKYADYLISFNGTGTSMDLYLLHMCLHILTMEYRRCYMD